MPTWQAAYERAVALEETYEDAQAAADAAPGDEELAAAASAARVAWKKESALYLQRKNGHTRRSTWRS